MREHAAGSITNGLALSKIRAYQAGFLIFSDFQRGALRLSALMELPVIHVFTHDSIGVGEDGPTHQPVEQIASLRAMPGMIDMRPADANEVVEAWRTLMPLRHDPVALILSGRRCQRWTAASTRLRAVWRRVRTCWRGIRMRPLR